jgi:hypothetical protein
LLSDRRKQEGQGGSDDKNKKKSGGASNHWSGKRGIAPPRPYFSLDKRLIEPHFKLANPSTGQKYEYRRWTCWGYQLTNETHGRTTTP